MTLNHKSDNDRSNKKVSILLYILLGFATLLVLIYAFIQLDYHTLFLGSKAEYKLRKNKDNMITIGATEICSKTGGGILSSTGDWSHLYYYITDSKDLVSDINKVATNMGYPLSIDENSYQWEQEFFQEYGYHSEFYNPKNEFFISDTNADYYLTVGIYRETSLRPDCTIGDDYGKEIPAQKNKAIVNMTLHESIEEI